MSALPEDLPDGPMIAKVREPAAAWVLRLDELSRAMFEYLAERLPEAAADPDIAGLTLASCTSNVAALVPMLRHGIPLSTTETWSPPHLPRRRNHDHPRSHPSSSRGGRNRVALSDETATTRPGT